MAAPFRSIDDEFADIAEQEPAFAGLYHDKQRRVVLLLTDPSRESSAREAIRRVSPERQWLEGVVTTGHADYGFGALRAWSRHLPDLFSIPGVVVVDIDERRNRLLVGIESESWRGAVSEALEQRGVPGDAVLVELRTRLALTSHTLQQNTSPRIGGFQTESAGWFCTLGFNVRLGSDTTVYFASNAHCTSTWLSTADSTNYYQATALGGTLIGKEHLNAPTFNNAFDANCPVVAGNNCKYTDIVLGRYGSGISYTFGLVARTTAIGFAGAGPITINHSSPTLTITGQASSVPFDHQVHKIGSASGWTTGFVTGTCLTAPATRGGVTAYFVCYDEVEAWAVEGDSGSGIFTWNGANNLTLVGQLFSNRQDCISDPNECHYYFQYSNLGSIIASLGAIDAVF